MSNGVSEIAVMQIIAGLRIQHPAIFALVDQLNDFWSKHQAEADKINSEWYVALQKVPPGVFAALDKGGIILELMKLHQDVVPAIVQVIKMIAPHCAELEQTLTETQAKAMEL